MGCLAIESWDAILGWSSRTAENNRGNQRKSPLVGMGSDLEDALREMIGLER